MKKAIDVFLGSCIFLFLISTPASAQDLNRLRDRAQKLLQLRVTGNKGQAVQYVDSKQREDFLQSRPLPIQEPKIVGLEFTDDPALVYVVVKSKVVLPDLGTTIHTRPEPWIWDKKDWFFHMEDVGDLLALTKSRGVAAPPVKPLPLTLSTSRLDLGKHSQGEYVKGVVGFTSSRKDIFLFRTQDNLPGLAFGSPVWKSDEAGEIQFVLDTTLLSEDVHYKVQMEVDGDLLQKTKTSFDLTMQIAPRIRIAQTPAILDPAQAGTVEISIENASNVPLKLSYTGSTNSAYRLLNTELPAVTPGEMLKLRIAYEAQAEPLGAQLTFNLPAEILGKPALTLPLSIKFPEAAAPEYSREQLERLLPPGSTKKPQ